jgi:sugar phosphate isomerase/epimerase
MTWRIGIATGACVEASILEALPAVKRSGAGGVEIGTPPRHFNPLQPGQIAALADRLGELGLAAISIHAPFGGRLDLADPNPRHRHDGIVAVQSAAAVSTGRTWRERSTPLDSAGG